MLNSVNDDTQFIVTFTKQEIYQIRLALFSLKITNRNHDLNNLYSSLLDAFQRSLNN